MGKLNMEMQPTFISDIRIFLPIIRCRRHTKGMGKASFSTFHLGNQERTKLLIIQNVQRLTSV